jgi:hypothetical protein
VISATPSTAWQLPAASGPSERRGQHRLSGPQPFPQHLDRAAVVIRGDLVALGRAGFPRRGARVPERDRGHRPDPV